MNRFVSSNAHDMVPLLNGGGGSHRKAREVISREFHPEESLFIIGTHYYYCHCKISRKFEISCHVNSSELMHVPGWKGVLVGMCNLFNVFHMFDLYVNPSE